MKFHAFGLLALFLFISDSAFAAPGGGPGSSASGMKNSGSMFGLCTKVEGNESAEWMQRGYCKAVADKLNDKNEGCNGVSGDLVDAARQKLPQNEADEFCPGGNIKADREKFKLFFKQVVAALTIEESNWKDGGTSSMGAKGLMQLSRGSVGGYAKCDSGCARIAKTGQIAGSSQANMDNMTCGTAIALVWVAKDGTMGGGSGNKGSRGIARYFQPYRNIDKVKRKRMQEKIANYCKKQLNNEPYREDSSGGGSTTAMLDIHDLFGE